MKPKLNVFNPETEFFIHEGCHIIEMINNDDDPMLSIARARVTPGTTTRWHRLVGITERYVILSGQGRVDIEGLAPQNISTGDTVTIPAMTPQRITNIGTDDLLFLAVCSPRFITSAYEDIEPTE